MLIMKLCTYKKNYFFFTNATKKKTFVLIRKITFSSLMQRKKNIRTYKKNYFSSLMPRNKTFVRKKNIFLFTNATEKQKKKHSYLNKKK